MTSYDPMRDIERLREAVDEFCRFIRELPEADLVEQAWGAKEVLAHEVSWNESYVAPLEAMLAGEPYEPPRGRFDDLNAQVVATSRSVPVEELLRRLRAADERLRGFTQTLDPQNVILKMHYKTGSWQCTLDDVITRVEAHIRTHHRELAREMKRISQGGWS